MSFTLGSGPQSFMVELSHSDPFAAEIRTQDGTDFPVGLYLIEFEGGPASWMGTVGNSPDTTYTHKVLRFDADESAVDAVIAAKPPVVRLTANGLTWAKGRIKVTNA